MLCIGGHRVHVFCHMQNPEFWGKIFEKGRGVAQERCRSRRGRKQRKCRAHKGGKVKPLF